MDQQNMEKVNGMDAGETKMKGMRLSNTTRNLYELMKQEVGGTDDTFIDHLLQIAKLHDMQISDPEFADELKELQKYLSRFSSVYIRMRERGADALEEAKKRSQETIERLEQDLVNIQLDLSNLQKRLTQREEELTTSYVTNGDLRTKMEQFEKTSKTFEDLVRLTNEKVEQKEKRIEELLGAEVAASEMKAQLEDVKKSSENELLAQKEVENELRRQLVEVQKEYDRRLKDAEDAAARMQKEHERALEVLKKEKEMETKEALLLERSEWQDRMTEMRTQLTDQHANKVAEMAERLQGKKRDDFQL